MTDPYEKRMRTMTQVPWENAVQRLLEDVYTFAATGPRTLAGWQRDALAVMNREVDDPRGWITLDWDKDNDEERTKSRPCFPFVPLSEAGLGSRLYPVTAETAARLLVEMTYEWGPVGTEEQTRAALADARTVLDRYGDRISCYSNVTEARKTPSPDLTNGVTDWNPLTEFIGDFGFVVVSSEEVGVFWAFDAR
ncbi:hypothetical protein [Streptomyces sp. HC307]|uniref:hypothetical protein n=1 Tax=Streptomyces flavusporus TaxID=3385496 RepID=UPI003916D2A3